MPRTCGMRMTETEDTPIALEVRHKLAKARELMHAHGLDALVLGRADSFAWITGGGDSRCASITDTGVASVLITQHGQFILTSNVEAERIGEEVLAHLKPSRMFDTIAYPWYEETNSAILRILAEIGVRPEHRYGADFALRGAKPVHPLLVSLRVPFTSWEALRYPSIGRGVSDAVERTCWRICPGMTEREIAGAIACELMSSGYTPAVLLVGADERVMLRRHPVPTDKALDRYCMIIVCAHLGGLTVALTRSVHFGRPAAHIAAAHLSAARVHASMIAATRPGATYQHVMTQAMTQYEAQGYPGEWQHHHQGGPIGYQDREFLVAPDMAQGTMQVNAAIAWNPSVTGAKSEDTLLLRSDGTDVVTAASTRWPMLEIPTCAGIVRRPDVLIR
jgi:Xaa-Pro dipeptidase